MGGIDGQRIRKELRKEKETLEDKLKYEIAEELGLMDKIKEVGWGGLIQNQAGWGLIT